MSIPNVLGALLFAALGVLLWTLALRAIRLRLAMKRWPVLPGVVRDHRTRGSRAATYVDFQVSYQFAERDHLVWCTSPTRAGYARGAPDTGISRDLASSPVGSTAEVYVNPARPEEAYLELPEQHMIAVMLGSGTLLVALSMALTSAAAGMVAQETATLAFMLVLGAVLSVVAISMSIALFRATFPSRQPPSS